MLFIGLMVAAALHAVEESMKDTEKLQNSGKGE
jgi:hypothetical protein